jgi:flagellin-like hook-associated protein FlgL
MFPNVNGANLSYLSSLARTQTQMNQAQTEVSSGYRVQQASDAPGSITAIFQTQASMALNRFCRTR